MVSSSPTSGRSPWLQVIAGLFVLIIIVLAPVGISCSQHSAPVHVKILAINDFHGQLPGTKSLNGEPAGGAPVLASYLSSAAGRATTFIALPGDVVGASPPESGLLLDEPTLLFWSDLADDYTSIATFGNHEFDRGTDELLRMIDGGNSRTTIAHLVDPYRSYADPTLSSRERILWIAHVLRNRTLHNLPFCLVESNTLLLVSRF